MVPGDDWLSIFHSPWRQPCEELALVLKAMDLDHQVIERPDGCHLLVPAGSAAAALEQLRQYRRENPRSSTPPWPNYPPGRGVAGALSFACLIALAYVVQSRYAWGIDWTHAGGLIAGAVREGEVWRSLTALCLHGDAAHVVGNMVFGGFFGYLAGQYLGSGVAGLMIVVTASVGNLLNAFVQDAGHRSIGASTAVFAALGLVAASVWSISRRFSLSWARRWSPVVGAVALLAFTGTGDEQTDIVAHLTGFLAGGAGGFLLWQIRRLQPLAGAGARAQAIPGAGALIALALAWIVALARI